LAKHGDISIDICEKTIEGEVSIKWEVTHNSKYGQPGPLAYKLDTLIINRRIEEARRPLPKILKLGSFREIIHGTGLKNHDTEIIKNALRQNAFAAITAKFNYRRNDGTSRTLEADFTRYSVVFLGEELPDGRTADAVYIILNDVYMQVINGAMTRPLDYDYLKILPPAAQRFYELLSYQMYAAIKNDRDRAKLVYSELCKYAPLVRQTDWNIARPQLARIHAPHRKSGYVGKIEFQDTSDSDGKPDWIIHYQPGPKARAEFRVFTKRGGPVTLEVEPFAADTLPCIPAAESSLSEAALISHGMTPAIAAELVRQYGEVKVALQVEHLEWLLEKKPGKVAEPGAWLYSAITNGISLPKGFVSKAERERQAEAKRQAERQAAEERRRKQEIDKNERRLAEQVAAYRQSRTPEQLAQLEAEAIDQASEETRQNLDNPAMKRFRKSQINVLTNEHIARLIQAGQLPGEPA
jgi:hypothetical protein